MKEEKKQEGRGSLTFKYVEDNYWKGREAVSESDRTAILRGMLGKEGWPEGKPALDRAMALLT